MGRGPDLHTALPTDAVLSSQSRLVDAECRNTPFSAPMPGIFMWLLGLELGPACLTVTDDHFPTPPSSKSAFSEFTAVSDHTRLYSGDVYSILKCSLDQTVPFPILRSLFLKAFTYLFSIIK